jgi:hypothetical protein
LDLKTTKSSVTKTVLVFCYIAGLLWVLWQKMFLLSLAILVDLLLYWSNIQLWIPRIILGVATLQFVLTGGFITRGYITGDGQILPFWHLVS